MENFLDRGNLTVGVGLPLVFYGIYYFLDCFNN